MTPQVPQWAKTMNSKFQSIQIKSRHWGWRYSWLTFSTLLLFFCQWAMYCRKLSRRYIACAEYQNGSPERSVTRKEICSGFKFWVYTLSWYLMEDFRGHFRGNYVRNLVRNYLWNYLWNVTSEVIIMLNRSWGQFWPQHGFWGHVWLHHILYVQSIIKVLGQTLSEAIGSLGCRRNS